MKKRIWSLALAALMVFGLLAGARTRPPHHQGGDQRRQRRRLTVVATAARSEPSTFWEPDSEQAIQRPLTFPSERSCQRQVHHCTCKDGKPRAPTGSSTPPPEDGVYQQKAWDRPWPSRSQRPREHETGSTFLEEGRPTACMSIHSESRIVYVGYLSTSPVTGHFRRECAQTSIKYYTLEP